MRPTEGIAAVAIFSSLIVVSDFAMAPLVNVKLLDTLVFVAAFVFGFRIGASVAIVSEIAWGLLSPWGVGGPIIPFLVGGELLFALSGYASSKVWGGQKPSVLSADGLYLGAVLAICAFVWDFETNIATGLIAGATGILPLMGWVVAGIPFMIMHELSDFALGTTLAPLAIVYSARLLSRRRTLGSPRDTSPMPRPIQEAN